MLARFIHAGFVALLVAAAPWSHAASVDVTPLSATLTAVPLPASLWLLGAGLAVLGRFRRSHWAAGSA